MRKRLVRLFLFPITAFLWLIGWCLYYVGEKHRRNELEPSHVAVRKDPFEIIVAANEEVLAATDES